MYLLKNDVSNLIVRIIAVGLGITYFIMDAYCNAQIEHRLSKLTILYFQLDSTSLNTVHVGNRAGDAFSFVPNPDLPGPRSRHQQHHKTVFRAETKTISYLCTFFRQFNSSFVFNILVYYKILFFYFLSFKYNRRITSIQRFLVFCSIECNEQEKIESIVVNVSTICSL